MIKYLILVLVYFSGVGRIFSRCFNDPILLEGNRILSTGNRTARHGGSGKSRIKRKVIFARCGISSFTGKISIRLQEDGYIASWAIM